MEHTDDRIIPLKMELLEKVPMSLADGYYIDGKLETFTKTDIYDGQLRVHIPDSFVDMPAQVRELKYTSSFRPKVIKTNLDCSVNFAYAILDNPENLTGLDAAKSFRTVLAQTNPAVTFNQVYTEKTGQGIEASCIDFISFGLDEHIYNLICLISVKGSLLEGIFNCLERDMNDWKEAAKEVFLNMETD